MKPIQIHQNKIHFILSQTNDGLQLDHVDQTFLHRARNTELADDDVQTLDRIYHHIVDNTVQLRDFLGVPNLARDTHGYIRYDYDIVEQLDFSKYSISELKQQLQAIQERCSLMLKKGLSLNILNYMEYHLWADLVPYDQFIFILNHYKTIYQKGQSVMFYNTELSHPEGYFIYDYTTIDLATGKAFHDQFQTFKEFGRYASEQGYEKAPVAEDVSQLRQHWLAWSEENNFKPWYLSYRIYGTYISSALYDGHMIEIPKAKYDYLKESSEIVLEQCRYQDYTWKLIRNSNERPRLKAIRSEGGKYFATHVDNCALLS